jgi:prepilin-type N-terminal cleavage/methylation domain-containing protein
MKKTLGYTLVEMMIVVAVIGILATITIVAHRSIQDRAQATALAEGTKTVEDAFRMFTAKNGYTTWPIDDPLTGINNSTIDEIIAATNLKNYLKSAPVISGMSTTTWEYDNDGDPRLPTACDTSWSGVNLVMTNVPDSVLQELDRSIDDGNTSCGRVRKANANVVMYQLSFGMNF